MSSIESLESTIHSKIEELDNIRSNTLEYGVSTPIVSLEIATLQIVAGGVNFLKAIIGNNEAKS